MKLFLDQDVYALTDQLLINSGHDVLNAAQLNQSQADDQTMLRTAQEQGRIFITRDKDFGNLVFLHKLGAGVIFLRMLPSTMQSVHNELLNLFTLYTEMELKHSFIVVEEMGHRIRRITGKK
jgi:predicted nuclease of predicted toxin-antitoxin system